MNLNPLGMTTAEQSNNEDTWHHTVEQESGSDTATATAAVPVEVEEEVIKTIIPIPSHMTQSDPDHDYFVLQKTKITTTIISRAAGNGTEQQQGNATTAMMRTIDQYVPLPAYKTRIQKRKVKSFLFKKKSYLSSNT